MSSTSLRWGIISTGYISNAWAHTITTLSDHKIQAVSSRNQDSAAKFAQEFNIPKSYISHEQLLADPDVDIVYVGIITQHHYSITKLALENGKHVLCEKPMTLNKRMTEQLLQLAKEKQRFLMEGFWSRCFPIYKHLREELKAGTIGDVRLISAAFGENNPLYSPDVVTAKDRGGIVLYMGCYCLQLALFVFGSEMPVKVTANAHLIENGNDQTTCATLTFSNNRILQLSCSSGLDLKNDAYIYGTKGCIKIPDFYAPSKMITPHKTFEEPLPDTGKVYYFHHEGLVYEAECIRQCIAKGALECPLMPHNDSSLLAAMMDSIRKEIGVVYDADNL